MSGHLIRLGTIVLVSSQRMSCWALLECELIFVLESILWIPANEKRVDEQFWRIEFHSSPSFRGLLRFFAAMFWWIFFRISRQIPENSDVCRFFNQICENKSEICRKFWILWKKFTIIVNYSLHSLFERSPGEHPPEVLLPQRPERRQPRGARRAVGGRGPEPAGSRGSWLVLRNASIRWSTC